MTRLTGALVACLGLGTADVAALNMWLLPGVLAQPEAPRSALAQPAAEPTAVPAPVPAPAPIAIAAPVAAPAPIAAPAPAPVPVPAPAAVPAPVAAAVPAPVAAAVPAPVAVPSPAPAAAPADSASVTRSETDAVSILAFDKGSWRVGQRATAAIGRVADRLRDRAGSIEVAGHADATGTDEVNDRISEQRAEAVARRLEQAGIAKERIAVTHFGARRPAGLPNDRRVEILARAGP